MRSHDIELSVRRRLARSAEPGAYVLTGSFLAIMSGVAQTCAARGTRIVSDEIYHGLSFGEPARTMLAHAPDALIVNSFSKYFSMPGWRLGWLVCPDDLLAAARTRVGDLFLTPPSLSQHAALAAFDARDELDGHLATYARNRALMIAALPRLGLGPIGPPDGAFYIYASVAELTDDSLDLCHRMLLETGVAAAPGVDFDPIDGRRFIRFSFALATPEVEDAIERLVAWLPYQRPA